MKNNRKIVVIVCTIVILLAVILLLIGIFGKKSIISNSKKNLNSTPLVEEKQVEHLKTDFELVNNCRTDKCDIKREGCYQTFEYPKNTIDLIKNLIDLNNKEIKELKALHESSDTKNDLECSSVSNQYKHRYLASNIVHYTSNENFYCIAFDKDIIDYCKNSSNIELTHITNYSKKDKREYSQNEMKAYFGITDEDIIKYLKLSDVKSIQVFYDFDDTINAYYELNNGVNNLSDITDIVTFGDN